MAKEPNTETIAATTELSQWQRRLLPFLVAVPLLLALVFIFLSTVQLNEFKAAINEKKKDNFIGTIIPFPKDVTDSNTSDYAKWTTLLHMEQESLDRRYKQAGFLLVSRVLTKYLGFFTGMVLAIVGAAFIIAKLSEGSTVMSGGITDKANFSLTSASPGIIFGVLGTVLMMTTILSDTEISVQEQPMYLNANTMQVIHSMTAEQNSPAMDKKNKVENVPNFIEQENMDSEDKP